MSEWTRSESDRKENDAVEEKEWIESLDWVIKHGGPERVRDLLRALQRRAAEFGISLPYTANTPYVNTIPLREQPRFPGHRAIERRIKSIIRWNAMAMVVRANRESSGIGGHISTYASAATLYEIGFNHFFRGKDPPSGRRPGLLPGARLARASTHVHSSRASRPRSSSRTSAAS